MSEILSRDDLIVTVNRLMISAMEDIDAGRNEAGDATMALVLKIEDHDRALRADNERLREALRAADEALSWIKFDDGVPVEWPEEAVIATRRTRAAAALASPGGAE